MPRWTRLLAVMLGLAAPPVLADVRITGVALDEHAVRVSVHADAPTRVRVAFAPRHAAGPSPSRLPVMRLDGGVPGSATGAATLSIPTTVVPRARFERVYLLDADTGEPVAGPHWVIDPRVAADHTQPLTWPDGIKGVSCPVGVADLVELGIKHVHVNLSLAEMFAPPGTPEAIVLPYEHHGRVFDLNRTYIEHFDGEVRELTEAGINVVVVVTNGLPKEDYRPTVHPDAAVDEAPHGLVAFNLSDANGVAHFLAGFTFMGERYTRPDAAFGTITGYIVGNELDSHWQWHNMGRTDLPTLVRQHVDELRLAWLALTQSHADARVFTSLTHSWARANSADRTLNVASRDLLEAMNDLIRAEGDFPWHVAYHPYPQDLFKPRWWNDALAVHGYDTPKITFRNIEVLTDYLAQDRFLFEGEPRRVILSEQGVHCPAGPDGEAVQAAAFALAFERIRQLPIDAFILHRHVDHRGEFGLRLGLWTADPDTEFESSPVHKRRIWHVMQAAETDRWAEVAGFAPAVAGWASLADAVPRPGPVPEHAPELADIGPRGRVAVDLIEQLGDATLDALAVEDDVHPLPNGGFRRAMMLHPKDDPDLPGTATFTLDVPAGSPALTFGTVIRSRRSNGVTFRVHIDGDAVFEHAQTTTRVADHRVDLSGYAGRRVTLVLEVDPNGDAAYDWAYWLTPAVMRE